MSLPQDLNPAYNMLLRSELLGCQCPSPISPDKATQLEQMRGASSPSKKILRFKSGAHMLYHTLTSCPGSTRGYALVEGCDLLGKHICSWLYCCIKVLKASTCSLR